MSIAEGKIGMRGHVIGMAIWKPFAEAPRDRNIITVMRRSHKTERVRFSGWRAQWTAPYTLGCVVVDVGGSDPVTHYVE